MVGSSENSPHEAELSFRPLERHELPWFVEVRNSVREYLHDPRAFTVADAEEWFSRTSQRYFVILLDDVKVGYFRTRVDGGDPSRMLIGADVSLAYQGQGIASRAYPKFIRWMADAMKIERFQLQVLPGNLRALHLYQKLGFQVTGCERASATSEVTNIHMELQLPPKGKS